MAMISDCDGMNEETNEENISLGGNLPVCAPLVNVSDLSRLNLESRSDQGFEDALNRLQTWLTENENEYTVRNPRGVGNAAVSVEPVSGAQVPENVVNSNSVCPSDNGNMSLFPQQPQPSPTSFQQGPESMECVKDQEHLSSEAKPMVAAIAEGNQDPAPSPRVEGTSSGGSENENVVAISQTDLELSFKGRCKVVLKRCDLRRSPRNLNKAYSDWSENEAIDDEKEVPLVSESITTKPVVENVGYINNSSSNNSSSGDLVEKKGRGNNFCNRISHFNVRIRQYIELNLVKKDDQGRGYTCLTCNKWCAHKWNTVVHVQIHTGETNFRCPFCNLRFRHSHHAMNHCIKAHNKVVSIKDIEDPEEVGGKNLKSLLLKPGSPEKNNAPAPRQSHGNDEIRIEKTENKVAMAGTDDDGGTRNNNLLLRKREGVLRLIHPDIKSTVEVEKDLLLHFLKPFLNSSDSPLKRDPEDYPDNGKELILSEVHAQLNEVWGTEKESDSEDEVKLSQEEMEDFPQRFEIPRRKTLAVTLPVPSYRIYTCKFCGFKCSSISQLLSHRRSRHGHGTAKTEQRLKSNMTNIRNKVIERNSEFVCNRCHNAYANASNLERHKKYSCGKIRGRNLNVQGALNRKIGQRKVIQKEKICDTETSTTQPEIVQNDNIKSESEEKEKPKVFRRTLYPCKVCDKKFSRPKFLQKHIETKHNNAEPEDKTDFPAEGRNVVSGDMDANTNQPEVSNQGGDVKNQNFEANTTIWYPCNLCSKQFSRPEYLKTHIRRMHENPQATGTSERKFKCYHCRLKFPKTELVNHVATVHPNQKGRKCWVCTKFCETSEEIHEHMIIHLEEKRFTCDICSRDFLRGDLLRNHMHVHSDERQFMCEICNRRFKMYNTLKVHYQTHLENRPSYKCKFCGLKFARKETWKRHVERKHAEKVAEVQEEASQTEVENENTTTSSIDIST